MTYSGRDRIPSRPVSGGGGSQESAHAMAMGSMRLRRELCVACKHTWGRHTSQGCMSPHCRCAKFIREETK